LKSNRLFAEGGKALAAGLKGNQGITELDISDTCLDNNSNYGADTSGIIAIADVIPDMGALSKLVMPRNNIHGAEAGKAFADMLAQNTVLKELDLSSQECGFGGWALDAAFAKEFAVGISDNRAMTVLNLANNQLGKLVLPEGWSEKYGNGPMYGYTHTDGREQKGAPEGAKPEGIIALANAIPDMRALVKLDISSNSIGDEQEGDLQRICVASGIELAK
jgi:hypothetical protein